MIIYKPKTINRRKKNLLKLVNTLIELKNKKCPGRYSKISNQYGYKFYSDSVWNCADDDLRILNRFINEVDLTSIKPNLNNYYFNTSFVFTTISCIFDKKYDSI